ncbi:MAG: PAS domain-containing protein [Rhodospirillales bacterium]|nr:PAS domain-containing protein [Rhodospirillales bacterium]
MEIAPAGTEQIQLEQEMPSGIERRLVLRLLAHWRILCGDRKLPAMSDIDPTAIPDIWPHCFLLEIGQAEGGHIFRASGDQIDNHATGSLVGMRVADAPPDALPGLAVAYIEEVLKKGVPISRGGEFTKPNGTRVLYRSILLPMGENYHTISGILGAANCREIVEN